MSTPQSVRFENVSKAFGTVVAVRDVSFDIQAGELVTLLGPSGCGKTTTLRMIAGLELATAGRILIGDRDVTALPATSRDVAMVFQSYALFPHMNVLDNVAYGLTVSGTKKTRGSRSGHAIARSCRAQRLWQKIAFRTFRRSTAARSRCQSGRFGTRSPAI